MMMSTYFHLFWNLSSLIISQCHCSSFPEHSGTHSSFHSLGSSKWLSKTLYYLISTWISYYGT